MHSIFSHGLVKKIKKKSFFIYVTKLWEKKENLKQEKLWENLHKQCRYDIRRAKKLGVIIEKSRSKEDLTAFYKTCESISKTKRFNLNGASKQLMEHLLWSPVQDHIESY